jgi:hypothetical protein
LYVLMNLFSLLFNVLYKRFLLGDDYVEILEEFGELHDSLFDTLDFVVALADGVEGSLGLTTSVRA